MALSQLSPSRVSVAAVLGCSAIGFLPLFAGPSYEYALAVGLWLPALAACASALFVLENRPDPVDALAHAASRGASLAGLGLLVAWLHGLRTGFCDPWAGSLRFVLGPGAGCVLGAVYGLCAALAVDGLGITRWRRTLAVGLALSGPLGGIAISIGRFYTSPMIFAFDPFVGFFAGTLYDTVVSGVQRLVTYRIGSLFSLLAASAVIVHLQRRGDRLSWRSPSPRLVVVGAVSAAASLLVTIQGPTLGHYQTRATIEQALGRRATSGRCTVIYGAGIVAPAAARLARECSAYLTAIERYFEARGPEHVEVFAFASAAEKGRLMGAGNTLVAKPWRHEIYIQGAAYPHPVLGHELAHVVAAGFGRGPLKIAGKWGGLLPDPGRIEGIAVAAAPREDSDLTPLEWAGALQRLGMLPPITSIFELGFLSHNSATAYTVAGAFISWLRSAYGASAISGWYGGAALPEVAKGKSLAKLEAEFRAHLESLPLSAQALTAARARFDRPAIFGRRCPHDVDRLAARANHALSAHDPEAAEDLYRQVLELDPMNFGVKLRLGLCDTRRGKLVEAERVYERLAGDERYHETQRAAALEAWADLQVLRGNTTPAVQAYVSLRDLILDEDHLRALDVKELVVEPQARAAITALLIGDPVLGADWSVAASELAAWALKQPERGTADYLLGKNFYNRGRFELAAKHLDRALARDLPLLRIAREARRVRFLTACALGQLPAARQAYQSLGEFELSAARRDGLRRQAERCGVPTGT